ncbi:mannose-6-phosphate isomerase, class I [Streptomyces solincola]|uniref:mannose-6-phosphate isomerase n=1 Tax=Streptomyces solincola TaxID=2100817 RepID=A0A2S9PV78_9ACTN|nr:mannose-6-phosphate isomerase, class I [Streptomyces solincola]PRH78330.1 mannose-6-phosphate isomerase, class I [Streptomyces solincola]
MDRLSNTVRPYAWGSPTAIPHLLGAEPTGEPQAEMWMGAHPGAPSRIVRGGVELPLDAVIDADPVRELGAASADKFGPRLPFLLKLLAADAPLSLQVHPDLDQARAGFAAEERAGIPVDAPHRNYRDANHKPELICALTPFEGLCGFREPARSAELLAALDVDSLKPYVDLLHAHPEEAALREVLTALLTADRDELAATVHETTAACERLGGAHAPYAALAHHYPGDPGMLAAMLLNHVVLTPGAALYLGAGVPHAYISGLGVEIMANSDNVLRCGLTPKHIDMPELLRVVRFQADDPVVLRPEASPSGEEVYRTPAEEFRLSRFVRAEGAAPADLTAATPQILLATAGAPQAGEVLLTPGQSVFVPAGEPVELRGTGTVFRATVVA